MTQSIQRIQSIFCLKLNLILRNPTIMSAPLISIIIVIIMKHIMPSTLSNSPFSVSVFLISFGLLFNNVMGGIFMGCIPLAEEKEKHTLRVLMTSSVRASEFFIASILPALVIITVVNIFLLPITDISFSKINLFLYLTLTIITALISLSIGYIVAMITKTQSQAQLIALPFCLFFTMFPSFSYLNETIARFSQYTYSGILLTFMNKEIDQQGYQINFQDTFVLLGWVLLSISLFLYAYKINGLDND